jgi:hypothetical protein
VNKMENPCAEMIVFNKQFFTKNIYDHIEKLKNKGELYVNDAVRLLGNFSKRPNTHERDIAFNLIDILFGANRDREISKYTENEVKFAEHIMLAVYDLVTVNLE